MLSDNIQFSLLSLNALQTGGLRAGQQFTTLVQELRSQLLLQLGTQRIPISPDSGLRAGQTVQVEVVPSKEGLLLRITAAETVPATATPPAAETATAATVRGLAPPLARVLESLGLLDRADTVLRLVPEELQGRSESVRQLLTVLLSPSTLGDDLRQVLALVESAMAAGAAPAPTAEAFQRLAGMLLALQTGSFEPALKQLGEARGIEARLALALETGKLQEALDAMQSTLRMQVGQLRGSEALILYLRSQGQLRRFERAVERILDRLAGTELQNTRSADRPYVFLDLPIPLGGGLDRVQIHFFGNDSGKNRSFDKRNAFVALDLSTARLGDLWVGLRVIQGYCQCHFRATSRQTLAAIEEAAPELVEALDTAGYPAAQVSVSPWDGNRLREIAALMRRFGGIDMNV